MSRERDMRELLEQCDALIIRRDQLKADLARALEALREVVDAFDAPWVMGSIDGQGLSFSDWGIKVRKLLAELSSGIETPEAR